ncbi:hypothetical protein [Pinibacter soli]|uniref:Uncharacterized protein n=1 Tax=Pinibacter soli TaxID=3044211 RepID=A0ABT6RE50_9BACT|nr:hypothetical protein [Pinibacter soli]MDI3320676.1 hypothetical protein [Pinibacter soli]
MAKTGAIFVDTSSIIIDESVYETIMNTLLNNGWAINDEFSYMVDGTYDFQSTNRQNFGQVFRLVKNSISNGKECFISLSHQDNVSIAVEVTYLNSKSIMFSIVEDSVTLKNMKVTDFSFYIERLASIFEVIDFNRIKCIYD